VHEALEKLAAEEPQKAELVKLRYFAGLSVEEAAEVLGISEPTAKRWWAYARGWLGREIKW
jgi:RNA polymerase sigma factor (sigma-70 family)